MDKCDSSEVQSHLSERREWLELGIFVAQGEERYKESMLSQEVDLMDLKEFFLLHLYIPTHPFQPYYQSLQKEVQLSCVEDLLCSAKGRRQLIYSLFL